MSRLPGGFGLRELGYLTAGVIGAAILLAGLVAAWSDQSNYERDPYRRVFRHWHRWLTRVGIDPQAGDTPEQLAQRQAERLPGTEKLAYAFARQINNHYYGGGDAGEDLARMKRLLRAMRKVAAQSGHRST